MQRVILHFLMLCCWPLGLRAQGFSALRGACFSFSYTKVRGSGDSTTFARWVRFPTDSHDIRLESGGFPVSPDRENPWLRFGEAGTWSFVGADSLEFLFMFDTFASIAYGLRMTGDSLVGNADFASDYGGPGWPRAQVVGHRCRSASAGPS